MTFGLTIEKLLLIALIAVMIIGPDRLPAAAESLRRTIQQVRRMARTAQERVREELGPEVADVDWQRLDPRQYDPRRIIREALLAEPDAVPASGATTGAGNAAESGESAPSAAEAGDPPQSAVITPVEPDAASVPVSSSVTPVETEPAAASVPVSSSVTPAEPAPAAAPAPARVGTAPPR